jgi:hypothetical protein
LSSGEQKAVEPMIRLLVKLDKDMKFKKMQVHNKAWVVKSMAKGLFLLVAGTVLLLISLFIAVVIIVAASNSGGDNNGIGGNLFFWLWLFDRTHNSSPVYIESDSGSYKTKVSPVWKSGKVRVVDDQTITAKKWRGSV